MIAVSRIRIACPAVLSRLAIMALASATTSGLAQPIPPAQFNMGSAGCDPYDACTESLPNGFSCFCEKSFHSSQIDMEGVFNGGVYPNPNPMAEVQVSFSLTSSIIGAAGGIGGSAQLIYYFRVVPLAPPAPGTQVPVSVCARGDAAANVSHPGLGGAACARGMVLPVVGAFAADGLPANSSCGQNPNPWFSQCTSFYAAPGNDVQITLYVEAGVNAEVRYEGQSIVGGAHAVVDPRIEIDPDFPDRDNYIIEFSPNLSCGLQVNTPADQTATPGNGVTFSVSATGAEPHTYEWRAAGGPLVEDGRIAGVTTDTLVINPTMPEDTGFYYCVVTGGTCQAGSALARLTMDCGSTVTGPSDQAVVSGETATLSVQASTNPTYGALSYRWHKEGIPLADGPTGSGASYAGTETETLTVSNVQTLDSGVYSCRVADPCLEVVSVAAALTVRPPPGNGDCDQDGDVDLSDSDYMAYCLSGPGVAYAGSYCACLDFEADGDADLDDLASLQVSFTGPPCGNGVCAADENCSTCAADCGECVCGDGFCSTPEDCDSCAGDCGPCFCRDGHCSASETCELCPQDCGLGLCGDGFCDPGECCAYCELDCGGC